MSETTYAKRQHKLYLKHRTRIMARITRVRRARIRAMNLAKIRKLELLARAQERGR